MTQRHIDEDSLEITLRYDFGTEESTSGTHVLTRPFRKLLDRRGGPIGKFTVLFFQPHRTALPTHILGCLSLGESGRLIFFPGNVELRLPWYSEGEGKVHTDLQPTELLDHFTLEPDLRSWHVTTLEQTGETRQPISRKFTREILDNVYYWFGLSLTGSESLQRVPSKLHRTFPIPTSDAERRVKLFWEARRDITDFAIYPPRQQQRGTEFLHFEFVVDKRSQPQRHDIRQLWTIMAPPAYRDLPQGQSGIRVVIHPALSVPEFDGKVWVIATTIQGSLDAPCVLTGYSSPCVYQP